jgi:hypothetical protein
VCQFQCLREKLRSPRNFDHLDVKPWGRTLPEAVAMMMPPAWVSWFGESWGWRTQVFFGIILGPILGLPCHRYGMLRNQVLVQMVQSL